MIKLGTHMRLHGRYVKPEGVKKQIEGGKQTSALEFRKLGAEVILPQ